MAQSANYVGEARAKAEAKSTLRKTAAFMPTASPRQLLQVHNTGQEIKFEAPGFVADEDAPQQSTSNSPPRCSENTIAACSLRALPPWALAAAANTKHLSQPWKSRYGNDPDDPNFATERDTIQFYDSSMKVCYSEGSMAA